MDLNREKKRSESFARQLDTVYNILSKRQAPPSLEDYLECPCCGSDDVDTSRIALRCRECEAEWL